MTTQIWQHRQSGERYIVAVDADGGVTDAAGPLYFADVDAIMTGDPALWPDVDGDAETAAALGADADAYRVTWPFVSG